MDRKMLIGAVLMVVGTVLFFPGVTVTGTFPNLGLALAALVLASGTYLIGTSENGRSV